MGADFVITTKYEIERGECLLGRSIGYMTSFLEKLRKAGVQVHEQECYGEGVDNCIEVEKESFLEFYEKYKKRENQETASFEELEQKAIETIKTAFDQNYAYVKRYGWLFISYY